MRKLWMLGALILALASCQSAPDRPLSPLPEKVTAMPYGRLLERARTYATQATEVSLNNDWAALEESARGLEQVAQYLSKAEDAPAKHRDALATFSGDLGKLATTLRTAAQAKDTKKTDETLTSINRKVREMRLGDGM